MAFERRDLIQQIKQMALCLVDDLAFHECDRNQALTRRHRHDLMDRR